MERFLTLLLVMSLSWAVHAKSNIHDYQPIFLPVYGADGAMQIALRVFKIEDAPTFLVVNPITLHTTIIPVKTIFARSGGRIKKPGYFTRWAMTNTRYYQLLKSHTSPPYKTENQGITHANDSVKTGNILTIDLCPSTKPFEADFFHKLIQLSEKIGKPVPVTLAITGIWLQTHPEEFQWLLTQKQQGKLNITWANHSFTHIYYNDLPYTENFLLSPDTHIETEILLTEKYLLEHGEVPSVFFRFPGLVSNASLMKQMKLYGLIPLGTDAWIANLQENNQKITPGGIILVHGNNNEHSGIVRLLSLLDTLSFIDIKDAV